MGGRISRAGGGVAEAARKLRAQGLMGGGMAMPRAMYGKGGGVCKKGMGTEEEKRVTNRHRQKFKMAGLKEWFKQDWVDINAPRLAKRWGFQ